MSLGGFLSGFGAGRQQRREIEVAQPREQFRPRIQRREAPEPEPPRQGVGFGFGAGSWGAGRNFDPRTDRRPMEVIPAPARSRPQSEVVDLSGLNNPDMGFIEPGHDSGRLALGMPSRSVEIPQSAAPPAMETAQQDEPVGLGATQAFSIPSDPQVGFRDPGQSPGAMRVAGDPALGFPGAAPVMRQVSLGSLGASQDEWAPYFEAQPVGRSSATGNPEEFRRPLATGGDVGGPRLAFGEVGRPERAPGSARETTTAMRIDDGGGSGPRDWSRYATGGAASREDSFTSLDPVFEERAYALTEAAHAAGFPIEVTSAYRSPELQAQLYASALERYGSEAEARRWVAPPGRSQHNLGRAVDYAINGQLLRDPNHPAARWIAENAPRFGLHTPLSNEPWQVELAGSRGGDLPTSNADLNLPSRGGDPQLAFGGETTGRTIAAPTTRVADAGDQTVTASTRAPLPQDIRNDSAAAEIYTGLYQRFSGLDGIDPDTAAVLSRAFLENFRHESGLDLDIEERVPNVHGTRGRGLYQVTGSRRTQFEQRTGGDYSLDPQLDFAIWELQNTERRAWDRILAAARTGDIGRTAAAVVTDFLRPAREHRDRRVSEYTSRVYNSARENKAPAREAQPARRRTPHWVQRFMGRKTR